MPLEDCIPYCSMSEDYLLDNYSEEYMLCFRECRKRMLKMFDGIKTFKKDQSRVYSSTKHQAFLQKLTEFQSDFASIVSGFQDEVIERKYDNQIKAAKKEYDDAVGKIADKCADFCYDKSENAGENDIAEIDFHLFADHNIVVKYHMADLSSSEEKELFKKIKDTLKNKSFFLKNGPLFQEQSEISGIYESVVTGLIKKHDNPRSVWSWGFFGDGAYDMWKRVIETLQNEFKSSAEAFQPKIKKTLKPGFDQENNRIEEEKRTAINKWKPLETRFSRLKIS
ncbi:hypothetical protein IKP13_09465 [bacterium]|nr:hypothetical protein [bacterium]